MLSATFLNCLSYWPWILLPLILQAALHHGKQVASCLSLILVCQALMLASWSLWDPVGRLGSQLFAEPASTGQIGH